MEKDKKIDLLKFFIGRFDTYYSGINSKGSFYLTLNTFIIGLAASGYAFLGEKVTFSDTDKWMLVILVIIAFACILLTLYAVNPFLNSGNSKKYSSLMFFGSISKMKENEFVEDVNEANLETFYNDFCKQTYQLSLGLNEKFNFMKWVGKLLLAEFLVITIVVISLLTK